MPQHCTEFRAAKSGEETCMLLYDISYVQFKPPRVMEIKTKINKWDLTKKLLHNEGNNKQDEKAAFRMGENNSK